jgi:hypothetical protein
MGTKRVQQDMAKQRKGMTIDFDSRVIVRMPAKMADLLEETAKATMSTRSDYVRRAVLEKLEKDGIQLPISE